MFLIQYRIAVVITKTRPQIRAREISEELF